MNKKHLGSIFGPLASVAGLSAGYFVASLNNRWSSPILSLGNRVIDYVPEVVKKFAIQIFGVNDKAFLVLTILFVVLGISVFIGRTFMVGKTIVAFGTVALMVVVAGGASLMDAGSNILSLIPTLVTGAVTIYILRWLGEQERANETSASGLTRREIFKLVGVVSAASIAATAAARLLAQRASVQVERIKIALPKPLKFLAKSPVDPALTTPGLSPLFTPNDSFYRIDTALTVPNISIEDWQLEIVGMVERPSIFTYGQLTQRPVFELDGTIACVSNEVGGDLVGNARWLGIRLDDLIKEASPLAGADQIMGYSHDGFSAGFPLAALDGRDAMIAFGMNGEVLPLEHGFPARIIVPGLYGYVSATKWLTRIELTRFDKKQGYWIPRGWSVRAPIKTASRIDTPKDGSQFAPGPRAIAGVAWAPIRGITKVEVRIGRGAWREATLGPELAKTTWRQWWIDWNPRKGEYLISVRATDGEGQLQSEVDRPVQPNGAEGWHTVYVRAN